MAAAPLIDLANIDTTKVLFDREDIRKFNPHRHELEQIDAIVHFNEDPLECVATRRLVPGEFWERGHFPGNPVFPGVLAVEAAAQAGSFCFHRRFGLMEGKVFGFGGLESVRFRGPMLPGDDIIFMLRAHALRTRRAVFDMQAWVNGKLTTEARIIGVTMPVMKGERPGAS